MHVPVNYFAVIVAAIASMALGFVWYGPLFGKKWIVLSGVPVERINALNTSDKIKKYVIAFLGSFITAYVLANVFEFVAAYFQSGDIVTGIMVGLWIWLGFIVPITLGSVLWEGKLWRLWAINNGYYLITFIVMGVIIALWQ